MAVAPLLRLMSFARVREPFGATGNDMEEQKPMMRGLRCRCGQRIYQRDVVRQGYLMRQFGPTYVYIRYRCSRCKRLGEHFIRQEEWEADLLSDISVELSEAEKTRFARMGAITLDEMREFRRKLDRLQNIPNPLREE